MRLMDGKVKIGLIIGSTIIIASIILGIFFYQAQKPRDTIQVVGLGVKEFEADTVKWVITLEEETGPDNLKGGYRNLENGVDTLIVELKARGITENEINMKPPTVYKDYNYEQGIVTRIRLQKTLFVITKQVNIIEALAFNPVELLDKGINIMSSNLDYIYSGLDELKKTLVADATLNAKERAETMLSNTGVKLGKLLTVRSGVFQITEPFSTDVSSMGIYDTSTRKKQISVTATAVFALK